MEAKDDLMKKVGTFGAFQKRTLCVAYLMSVLVGPTVMMCNVFIVYTPQHRCYIPSIDENENLTDLQTGMPEITEDSLDMNTTSQDPSIDLSRFIPIEDGPDGKPQWSQCYRFVNDSTQDQSPSNRSVAKCDRGWKYFATPGLLSATMEFDLVCDAAWMAPLASSIQVFGFIFGTIGGGYISDRFGRRFAILVCWCMLIVCSALIAVLPIWVVSYPLWFFMGASFVSRSTNGVIIINELTPIKYRYKACFVNMIASATAYMMIPLLNFLVQNWRYYLALQAGLQTLAFIPIFCYIKESLNWLLQNKQYNKAVLLIKEIGRVNKRCLDDENTLLSKRSDMNEITTTNNKEEKKRRMSYIHLISISFLRKRMFLLALAWIAVSVCYYGLSINTNDLGGDRYIASFLSGAMEVPGYTLCYIGLEKLGGRRTFMVMTGLSGISLMVLPWILSVNQTAVIACNMIGKLFISGSFATMYVFVGDFFPTLLRTQAYGATSFPARITTMLVPYLLFLGDQYFKPLPYLVMGTIAISAAFGMCLLPETKNTALPETLEDAKNQKGKTCLCGSKHSDPEQVVDVTATQS